MWDNPGCSESVPHNVSVVLNQVDIVTLSVNFRTDPR
ncbi:UNVERIFIED_ORG: hypothetical protein ABID57_003735 [Arthrobacter sp. UYEF1]